MYKDDITHKPLVVSNASTNVIRAALVAAHQAGRISDEDYAMTYAEVCELGFLPQSFGGRAVGDAKMNEWKSRKSWDIFQSTPVVHDERIWI